MLEDGEYPVFVVDADETDAGGTALELTILTGDHKGDVVSISTCAPIGDPIELLGTPGTLRVRDGSPTFIAD